MSAEIEEIISNLEYIASTQGVIRVDGTFLGVSIRLDTHVAGVDLKENRVHLRAQGVNVVPFSPGVRVILRCVLFPKPVQASVAAVDPKNTQLTLDRLMYVIGTMGKRLRARVQPKNLLQAKLFTEQGELLKANIADISAEGLGLILMAATTELEEALQPYDQIRVQFQLTGSDAVNGEHVLVSARVVYINPLEEGQRHRVGLHLHPDKSQSKAIRRYIYERQMEAMSALEKTD
jgi:hypothetical protein